MATRVIGYIRVSTDRQADRGFGLAVQRAKVEAYAIALGLTLVDVVVDAGASAKSLARAGLQAALERLEAGEAEGLLVARLDRLTRSVRDLGDLVETYFAKRFSLLSVSDSIDTRSVSGRMVLNIIVSVAQWERESIAEKMADGRRAARAKGVRFGAKPLEGPAVERIQELRAGGATLQGIAATLTAEGYATLRGGRWAPATVARVLARGSGRLAAMTDDDIGIGAPSVVLGMLGSPIKGPAN